MGSIAVMFVIDFCSLTGKDWYLLGWNELVVAKI